MSLFGQSRDQLIDKAVTDKANANKASAVDSKADEAVANKDANADTSTALWMLQTAPCSL